MIKRDGRPIGGSNVTLFSKGFRPKTNVSTTHSLGFKRNPVLEGI